MNNAPKIALVTGASSGIGRATAEALSRAGYRVYGTTRSAAPADAGAVRMLTCDVTDQVSVETCVAQVLKDAGRIDLLVNNAGIGLFGAAEESSVAQAKQLFETNFFGLLRVTNAVLPAMRRQGYEYYWKTHAHPNSTFKYTTSSLLDLMRWDATEQMELIDQPLLMIAGSKADSLYMTKDAFPKATGTRDKELFEIEGATHIETYWVPQYVDVAMAKLAPFFARTLVAGRT